MNNTLTKNFKNDYKPDYMNDKEHKTIFDIYGNPTPETLRAFYEVEHGLTEEVSLEELRAWANEDC